MENAAKEEKIQTKEADHFIEALSHFLRENDIRDFNIEPANKCKEIMRLANKRISDLKSTQFVVLSAKKEGVSILHFPFPYLQHPNQANVYIPVYCPFSTYAELNVIPTPDNWGRSLCTAKEVEMIEVSYGECSICMENQHPICLSINCFHEVCQACSKELKICPLDQMEANWVVMPTHKQNIKSVQSKDVKISWRGFGSSWRLSAEYYCSVCRVGFDENNISFHSFLCKSLRKDQLAMIKSSRLKLLDESDELYEGYARSNNIGKKHAKYLLEKYGKK